MTDLQEVAMTTWALAGIFQGVVVGLFVGILGIPLGFMLRRIWHRCFTEYDRSMLIRLQPDEGIHDPKWFAGAPVIVGTFPFREFKKKRQSDLDIRNVVGFVIGDVRKIKNPEILGVDKCEWGPGYYAYCVINWEYATQVQRMWKRGIHISKTATRLSDPEQRGSRFIGFSTDPPKGNSEAEKQGIAHFQEGFRAFARYQPYAGAGFKAYDIKMRQLSVLTRILIWFKNFVTKEWTHAW